MKRSINIFILILSVSVIFTACQQDYETMPVEQFTIDFVFSTTDSLGVKAHEYLNAVYSYLDEGYNRVNGDYLDAATDDAVTSSLSQTDVYKLSIGNYTPVSLISSEMRWSKYYKGIRTANTFIENIDVVPLMETFNDSIPMNVAWKSEARYLRAYYYFELIKRYGAVPLVGEIPLEIGGDLELPRNTFEECVDYIISELDAIRDSLRTTPLSNVSSYGHVITRETAMALKSRVLLYAASPLFNGNTLEDGNELVGYASYDAERWKDAADAAKYFLDTYSYFVLDTSHISLFVTEGDKEVIFFRQGGSGTGVESTNGPVGFTDSNLGNGRTSPSQNLVECFPMIDGKAITDNTSDYTYDELSPYKDRDPRLDWTILHNGSNWLNTELETYQGGRSNPSGATQKTKTSYYMRKFMGDFAYVDAYSSVEHNWVVFRLAEIMLNFAEAQNEYSGPDDDVYQVLKDLRARAGIEEGTDGMYGLKQNMTREEMREAVRLERRIELAFEEHRYWDIRRWRIAEEVMNEPIRGLIIIKSGIFMIPNEIEVLTPSFKEKHYLYPIPYSEVIKNSNMIQNPGWE